MAAKRRKKAAQTSNVKQLYTVLIAAAVLGIGAIGYAVLNRGEAATAPIQLTGLDNPQALVERASGVEAGNPDAPVKVIVFSDFQCPHCRDFALQVEPQVKAAYIDTNKIDFVVYDYPLGGGFKHSFLAARAARCAGDQNKYWEYHDLLFSRQAEWSYIVNAPTTQFSDYAKTLGLDGDAFDKCLNSDKYADIVTANHLLGEQLGVTGTPTVIINNRNVAAWNDFTSIKAIIDEALGS